MCPSSYLSAQMNQFIEPDVKRVYGDSEDESSNQVVYQLTSENPAPVENHRQQLSLVYPSASNFHHRFSRVMRKRGNPYWVPRTHENLDKLALPEETDYEEVGNVQTVS